MKLVALAVAVLTLAACGADPPEQVAAESFLSLEAGGETHCTERSKVWFKEQGPASVFVCAVDVGEGFCDRYRVDRNRAAFRSSVLERRTGCVLPVG